MSARDDLALARRHPAATTVTLVLILAFGATLPGLADGGWSTATALVVAAVLAGWLVWIGYGPAARREHQRAVPLAPLTGDTRERYEALRGGTQLAWPDDTPHPAPVLLERIHVTGYKRDEEDA